MDSLSVVEAQRTAANIQLKDYKIWRSQCHGMRLQVCCWSGRISFYRTNMDDKLYLQILKESFKKSTGSFGILGKFLFCEDNNPKHKEKNIREWLLYNCPKVKRPLHNLQISIQLRTCGMSWIGA